MMGDAFGPGSRSSTGAADASPPSASIPIAGDDGEHHPLDHHPGNHWEYGVNYGARRIRGFMCKTDWDHELGAATGGTSIYPSLDDLREHRPCVAQCGIVQVEVTLYRIVRDEDYSASGIETRRAETEGLGAKPESPAPRSGETP